MIANKGFIFPFLCEVWSGISSIFLILYHFSLTILCLYFSPSHGLLKYHSLSFFLRTALLLALRNSPLPHKYYHLQNSILSVWGPREKGKNWELLKFEERALGITPLSLEVPLCSMSVCNVASELLWFFGEPTLITLFLFRGGGVRSDGRNMCGDPWKNPDDLLCFYTSFSLSLPIEYPTGKQNLCS